MKGRLLGALVMSGALAGGAVQARAANADPYQIFAHARSVWAQQRYPHYLTYTVTVRVSEGGVDKIKHYHLSYNAQDAKIYVNPVSDEERAAPPNPSGMTFHLLPRRKGKVLFDKKVGHPSEAVDYLGVPMISPTYSFGMGAATLNADSTADSEALVQEIRREYDDPTPPATAQEIAGEGKLKTIAVVAGYRRRYIVTFDGIEEVDGHDCYHLSLKPARPSTQLRLRELWIDTQTYQTRQLVTAANFTGSEVPWLVTFANLNGALYIENESAMAPVGVGDHRYERASVSFDGITATDHPPAKLSGWFVTKENIMAEPGTPVRSERSPGPASANRGPSL